MPSSIGRDDDAELQRDRRQRGGPSAPADDRAAGPAAPPRGPGRRSRRGAPSRPVARRRGAVTRVIGS